MASRPSARVVVSLSLGLAFFLLGSTYLALSESEDVTSVIAVGGERLRAGSSAHLRVQARLQPARTAVPVQLERLYFDGNELPFEQRGDSPVMIGFKVPERAPDKSSLTLVLKSGEVLKRVVINIVTSRRTSSTCRAIRACTSCASGISTIGTLGAARRS